MRMRHVPVDEVTKKVCVTSMRRMISSRTVMLVGSAPQFPHGVMDDIQEIAALGGRYDIPVHVDACLGGFLIAFMDEAGFPLSPFDFRVPGVTSISADTHKYGFAPKGSSVLVYKEKKYRDCQWFSFPDWPGGIYATPTIGGSRAGGIVAACWAALLYFGREGYVSATRDIVTTTRRIADAIRATPGVAVIGCPDVSVVAFDSPEFNIYAINDGMKERGWALNALQFPSCLHLAVTKCHTLPGVADRFIKDLQEVTGRELECIQRPTSILHTIIDGINIEFRGVKSNDRNVRAPYDGDTRGGSNSLGNPPGGRHNVSGCTHITLPSKVEKCSPAGGNDTSSPAPPYGGSGVYATRPVWETEPLVLSVLHIPVKDD